MTGDEPESTAERQFTTGPPAVIKLTPPILNINLGVMEALSKSLARQDAILRNAMGGSEGIIRISQNLTNLGAITQNPILGPGVIESMNRALRPVIDAQASIMSQSLLSNANLIESIGSIVGVLPDMTGMMLLAEQLKELITPLQSLTDAWSKSINSIDFDGIRKSIAALMPPNWPDDVKFEAAQRIMNEFGIPLVWLPRAEVVILLTEAPDAPARSAVLLSHSATIIADIRQCLSEVDGLTDVQSQVELARGAVDTYEAGFAPGAQALATVVLDSLVMAYVGAHSQVRKKVQRVTDDTPLRGLIRSASLSPLALAYEPFWPDKGDPIPTNYNRHATVHAGETVQFTPENSLVSLMMVTSFLKTIQRFYEVENQDAA